MVTSDRVLKVVVDCIVKMKCIVDVQGGTPRASESRSSGTPANSCHAEKG